MQMHMELLDISFFFLSVENLRLNTKKYLERIPKAWNAAGP